MVSNPEASRKPRKSLSRSPLSTDTKNETEKRILTIFTIGQSFVKSIGVFPGVRGTSLKIRLGLKELIDRKSDFTVHIETKT